MKVENIIKGLQIIEAARPEGYSPYHFRAEHDEIFAGSLSRQWEISEQDKRVLEDLGWIADENIDGYRTSV